MGSSGGSSSQEPTTSKWQRAFEKAYFPYAAGQVGQGVPSYGGQLTAEAPSYMAQALAKLGSYGAQPSNTQTQSLNYLTNAMQGTPRTSSVNPEGWGQAYENQAWDQMKRAIPMMDARYAGAGFFNPQRNKDINSALAQTALNIANQRTGFEQFGEQMNQADWQFAQQQAMQAAAAAPQMEVLPQQMAIGAGQQQMGLDQAALQAQYNEWLRTQPQNNPWAMQSIGAALSPTMNTVMQPSGYSLGAGAMGGMVGGLGAAMIPALSNPLGISALAAMGLLSGMR